MEKHPVLLVTVRQQNLLDGTATSTPYSFGPGPGVTQPTGITLGHGGELQLIVGHQGTSASQVIPTDQDGNWLLCGDRINVARPDQAGELPSSNSKSLITTRPLRRITVDVTYPEI